MNLHLWYGKINKIFFPLICSQVFWPQKHKSKPFNSLPALYLPDLPTNVLSSLPGVELLRAARALSKISSQDKNSQSHLCSIPCRSPIPQKSHTISVIGSHGAHLELTTFTRLAFVDGKNAATQCKLGFYVACRQETAAKCHTPPYQRSLAGAAIHFTHCISRNFPWRGGEPCCLLSELCKKPAILFLQQKIVCTPELFWLLESHGVGFPWKTERMNGRQLC